MNPAVDEHVRVVDVGAALENYPILAAQGVYPEVEPPVCSPVELLPAAVPSMVRSSTPPHTRMLVGPPPGT
jgi:hypothetical protein